MTDTSARALVDHWGWAAQKGLMNRKTAEAYAGACRGVLRVQDGWENLDVETLDIDDFLRRFKQLRSMDFSPNSLRDYETRFRRAIGSFRKYLDDPAGWRFPSRVSSSHGSARMRRTSDSGESAIVRQATDVSDKTPAGHVQEYFYPFRPDVLATLVIPRDATTAELNRLVAWARTLAVDYEPQS